MEECLFLPAPTVRITRTAMCHNGTEVPTKRLPTFDLPVIIRMSPSPIIPTIPLKPSPWIIRMYPPFFSPIRQGFTCIHTKIVECRIVPFMTELGVCKPITRKLVATVSHIFTPKDTECKHLLGRQVRNKIRTKILSRWLRECIVIPMLHHVVYNNGV